MNNGAGSDSSGSDKGIGNNLRLQKKVRQNAVAANLSVHTPSAHARRSAPERGSWPLAGQTEHRQQTQRRHPRYRCT